MMSPFGLDDRTPPGVNCFAQLQTPIVTSSDHVDVTSGLENMSLVSSQLAMQSMAATMFPSSVPFGGPMHMASWPMYQWPHAVQSPRTNYPGFIPPGSIPAASPPTFQMPTASSHPSPGPATPRKDVLGRPIQPFYRSEGRRTTAIRINRTQFSPPGPHHNHVDINRIKAGTDVRTTVCLALLDLPSSALTNNHRSCSETFPTKWTKRCSNASLMSQVGASTILCT